MIFFRSSALLSPNLAFAITALRQLLAQGRGFFHGIGQNGLGFGLLVLVQLEAVGKDIERGLALRARHSARVVSHPASPPASRSAGVVAAHSAAALSERQR